MSLAEDFLNTDDLHPIDIVETLAEHHDWEFDRVTDDQIADKMKLRRIYVR